MSAIYNNWERLVDAVLKKEQLWQLFHAQSSSPSIHSEASDPSSISNLNTPIHDHRFGFSGAGSSSRLVPKLVLVSNFSPAFDVEDVFLTSAKLLGRGTFGSVYAASMENGVKIVVRRLNSSSVSEQDFKRHMEIVGDVRHENLVPLTGYSSSKDERLMMYDYYSKGSVYELLHGYTGKNRAHVDWKTRRKIAIGAARGIAEIHSHIDGTLVHGNIKSSNIFLNSEHYGCVSDLGLTSMIETTFIPSAHCYAPEVKNTRSVSQASDVYSFGILLLELLTRKSATRVHGGPEAVNLVKLVGSVKSKERASKIFDADLLNHPALSDQMVKVLQIGMRCIEKSIKKRPKMSEVMKILEDSGTFSPTTLALERNKLVFFYDNNYPSFDLEDILRADAKVLGEGKFGTSYKAVLEEEHTFVMKRLKDIIVKRKDFQHHMEVIGRIRHDNLAKIRAYYISRDEKLLMLDYYNQGSLSTLLHGTKGTVRTALDWKTRLKIAVGAARGIAHIHRQDGGKFVHGNIKSSKIFLNGQTYGIVSDFGMSKLTSPVKLSLTRSLGYTAPEVTDPRRVSQSADVYSFGVVLLELVSGLPPQRTRGGGEVVSLVNWIQLVVREEWTAKAMDVELLGYQENEEGMMSLIQIGMDCVSNVPERRPRMSEVVKMLEGIGGVEPPNELRLVESRLEYLLEDMLPTMTPE